jgi:hypothetical protein
VKEEEIKRITRKRGGDKKRKKYEGRPMAIRKRERRRQREERKIK